MTLEQLLIRFDKKLADEEVPIHHRSLHAGLVLIRMELDGRLPKELLPQETKLDKFVIDWYHKTYGESADFPTYFGKRLVLIRHTPCTISFKGSLYFKPESALTSTVGLSPQLVETLTEGEQAELLVTLKAYYDDEDIIRLAMHEWGLWSTTLSGKLIYAGWHSLNDMAVGFRSDDCGKILDDAVQAVEKYLKGLYCLLHLDANESDLIKRFSHSLDKFYQPIFSLVPEIAEV